MMLFLSSMFALTIWAVVGSLVALRTDGLGDGELARRNRHPEPFPRER